MESDFSMFVRIFNAFLVLTVIFSAGFLLTGIAAELSASAISRTDAQNWQQGWVDQEADIQASRGRMGHYQQCPSGYRAGVGMSTRGPEDAIRRCCYWNSRLNVRWFSVRRSGNAWYAAALYRN